LDFFNVSGGSQSVPRPRAPPLPGGTPTAEDASRFLNQCTCGATTTLIQKVQTTGFDAFLNEQFALPATSNLAFIDQQSVQPPNRDQTMDAWWTLAIAAPDQVRQRATFALSEILVVSFNNGMLDNEAVGLSSYVDTLSNDAFGNYRQLLEDVTLSPTMGVYLDMLGTTLPIRIAGGHPNENYARELMQTFSIGLYKLNIDGSLALDMDGLPIPSYDQGAVTGLAAVLTGWTLRWSTDFYNPTEELQSADDQFSRIITLRGKNDSERRSHSGWASGQQDLQQALDTIFNHPNVG